MAYGIEKWERARAYFESGQYTLAQINQKTGISISKISEKAKRENGKKGKMPIISRLRRRLRKKKGKKGKISFPF